jgi:hypothetical protein
MPSTDYALLTPADANDVTLHLVNPTSVLEAYGGVAFASAMTALACWCKKILAA